MGNKQINQGIETITVAEPLHACKGQTSDIKIVTGDKCKINVYYTKTDGFSYDDECNCEVEVEEEDDPSDVVDNTITPYRSYTRFVANNKFTTENTKVISTINKEFNAYHHYVVANAHTGEVLCKVDFQEGPIKEVGVNGVFHEDLILMIIDRLESFQNSPYKCKENEDALDHLYEAIDALRARTNKRKERGVQGTSNV